MGTLIVKPRLDTDTRLYVDAVETADGDFLEVPVQKAINSFITGCKRDGVWDAIMSSCIMAGTRTLNGALVPLVGTAPTNFNFVEADYNRKTGLKGDGSTKFLLTAETNLSLPSDSRHLAIYMTEPTGSTTVVMGTGFAGNRTSLVHTGAIGFGARIQSSADPSQIIKNGTGLAVGSRIDANSVHYINESGDLVIDNILSVPPTSSLIGVFASGTGGTPSTCRASFYSMGSHVDVLLLDKHVSILMNNLNSVIP